MKQYQRIRGTSPELDARAKELRWNMTEAEQVLWLALSGKKLDGFKFRRQHAIGQFILDFCCLEKKLVVEVDGGIHNTQKEHDAARNAQLAAYGYTTLRLSNKEVLADLPAALERIRHAMPPNPPSLGGTVSVKGLCDLSCCKIWQKVAKKAVLQPQKFAPDSNENGSPPRLGGLGGLPTPLSGA